MLGEFEGGADEGEGWDWGFEKFACGVTGDDPV